ncbi:putative T7SS-secreted protein [Streptomyces syringium]|uniref:putative T7SS-secreted protein n=1 Tax=Streptomyces syringium TaxID=76729 RepID=UPI003412F24E
MGTYDMFKDVVNAAADKAGDLVDKGKEKAGEAVDWGTEQLAAGLDRVGLHDAADVIEDAGDFLADRMGAKVSEQQLGQTEQASGLIHGSPGRIRASALHLKDFHAAFDRVGQGMKGLDSGRWRGEAAEAFRKKFAMHPQQWLKAADACEEAYKALESYAETVTWAQGQAKEAIAAYKAGKEATRKAVAAHNEAVHAYNAAVDAYNARLGEGKDPGAKPTGAPGAFSDPGAAKIKEAREILARARSQRDSAAEKARETVGGALAHAPEKPEFTDRVSDDFADFRTASVDTGLHVVGGATKGAAGVVKFARGVFPLDPYNVTHPALYLDHLNSSVAGLVTLANHPDRAPQALLGDGWGKDPREASGRLGFDLTSALATGGTSAAGSAGRRAVAAGARETGKEGAESLARRELGGDAREPARTDGTKSTCETDPVDLATGKMFLSQTDVALPGTLPLVFRRRVQSGYRLGRWFGPSWSSTVDQRLEIDAAGVVFVQEDGLLLDYPHPAPGVPTLPVEGPRWPLENAADGGYVVTDPVAGRTWHFTPHGDELALLDQISDRGGHWITVEHDTDGTPTALAHDGGYRVRVSTEAGRVTALHLVGAGPGGTDTEIVRYGCTDGDLTEVINSSALPLRFTYDERGRVTSWTDRNDSRYDYVYDDEDRCVHQSGVAGHMRSTVEYGPRDPVSGLRVTSVTNSLGHTSRLTFNAAHQLLAETDPTGATTRYRWDRYDRLLSRTDPLGRTTRFRHDEDGRLVAVVRPDGREATTTYNAQSRPETVTHADGTTWRQTFDDAGRRTSVTDPSGATTRYAYDALGHPASVTDALGNTTHVRCDRAGLPVETTDPLGGVTTYLRDAFGRVTTVVDPLGATTRLSWSVEGKLLRHVAPDGSEQSWTYDGEGNCTTHTDALGGVTRSEYTHFDLLSARTGPDGVRHEFTHDTRLQLVEVTNPQDLTWSYTYDAAGRLAAETDFDGRTLTYAHDDAGRLTARTDASGRTIAYRHDELGRVVAKDADGQVTTYAHDPAGRLLEASGPDTTLLYSRDRLGRIKSETADGRTTVFTHDALGRRTRRVTPTGAVSTWTYDAAGRHTSLTASGRAFTMEHDAAGREIARHFGEALTLSHDWDATGRLNSQTLTGEGLGTVQSRTYTYRRDGNLTAVDDHLSGLHTFDVDAAGRVTAVSAPGWSERYAYDEAGNQTEAAWPAEHTGPEALGSRSYTGTRIHHAGRVRYEHDDLGRVVLRQKPRLSRKPDTWRYAWDAQDRLVAVVTPDGTRWQYLYDPLGRRIAKQRLTDAGDVAERVDFTWDGPTLIEQTTTTAGLPNPVTLTWDHDGLRPVSQSERITTADAPQTEIDSRFFAIVTDLVGTPSELVDESGTIAWRSRATLWGATAWAAASTAYTPLRFPGQYFDPESGLHYNFHRHYDPETARYASPDPLGLAPSPNPSAYVHNPLTWADPLGLAPCPEEHLFRGTTPGHEGSSALRSGVTPTSTDPGVATAFATQSESFGPTVVMGIPVSALEGIETYKGYIAAEAEVGVALKPLELADRASFHIPAGAARDILKDMGIYVPRRIDLDDLSAYLKEIPKLSPEQISRFITEAQKYGR